MFLPDQSRQQAVFDRLRQGILVGTLPAGARLPPTRALAEELGVARQTVVLAYERLASEGYVRARTGSGTYVAPDLPDAAPAPAVPPPTAASSLSRRGQRLAAVPASAASRDAGLGTLLAGGIPAPDLFPKEAWARCAARVLKSLSSDITGYPPPQGLPELRGQIAAHLAATRGLLADPANIVVTAGTQQALRIAAELLLDPGDAAWVEDPGYIAGRGALLAAGAVPVPVLSDAEGLDVAAGIQRAPDARLALVAPSHATPLGGALPIGRRLALLDWAGRANAWILEDDCDSEFRWSGHPLPPLATLDRVGRVIYCGTFSKTLAPALRLGFAVVPAPLVRGIRAPRHADGSRHRHAQSGDPRRVHAPGPALAACPAHAHRVCPPARRPAGGDRAPCAIDRADPRARWAAHGRAVAGRHRRSGRGAGLPGARPRGVAAGRVLRRAAAHGGAGHGVRRNAHGAGHRHRTAAGGGTADASLALVSGVVGGRWISALRSVRSSAPRSACPPIWLMLPVSELAPVS